MLRINVIGSILCAREAVRRMSTAHGGKGGAIVNLSSVAATLGAAGQYVDYAASKGAIDTFTIGLAREVATEGIRVNCGAAGHHRHRDPRLRRPAGSRRGDARNFIPMKREGTADEVARRDPLAFVRRGVLYRRAQF